MIILCGLLGIVLLGVLLAIMIDDIFFIASIFAGVLLFISLIAWPINFYCVKGDLASFEQIRLTLRESRKAMNNYECAAMVLDMTKNNKWLRGQQYWNNTIFDIWIPDEVETTEFLSFKK